MRGNFRGLLFTNNRTQTLDIYRAKIESSAFRGTKLTGPTRFREGSMKETDLHDLDITGINPDFYRFQVDEDTLETNPDLQTEYLRDTNAVVTSEVVLPIQNNKDLHDFVCDLLVKNRGIFFGDNHKKLNFPLWIVENMHAFKKCGVETLYIEMIAHKDNELLDDFFNNEENSSYKLMKYLLVWEWAFGSAATRFQIISAAKNHGIRVKGIDTAPDLEEEFWPHNDRNVRQRSADWATNIEAFENNSPSTKFIVFGGGLHGSAIRDWFGVDAALGIPEIFIQDTDGPELLQLSNGIEEDYLLRLPKSLYDGVGPPGSNFLFWTAALDSIIEQYDQEDSDNYLALIEIAQGLKKALSHFDKTKLDEISRAIEKLRSEDKLAVSTRDVPYNYIVRDIPPVRKGGFDQPLIAHMSEMVKYSMSIEAKNNPTYTPAP